MLAVMIDGTVLEIDAGRDQSIEVATNQGFQRIALGQIDAIVRDDFSPREIRVKIDDSIREELKKKIDEMRCKLEDLERQYDQIGRVTNIH